MRNDGFGLTISDDSGAATIGVCGGIEFCSSGRTGNAFKEGTADTPKPRRLGDRGTLAGGSKTQVEDFSKSDVLVNFVENLCRSFQFGGSCPFRTPSRVVKLLLRTRWS